MRSFAPISLVLVAGAASLMREPAQDPPAQPLRFSHRVHAGELRMGCSACHPFADRAAAAGVPSVARCLGCHRYVRQDPGRPALGEALRPLVAKLKEKPPSPIAWARVHRLPDHVRFSHAPHARAEIVCRTCHGAVETMDEVRQASSLQMGWCLECHRRHRADRPEGARLTDCLTCHK